MTLVFCTGFSLAAETGGIPEKKRTLSGLYLTATEANHMKQNKGAEVAFIDVRARAEIAFIGMPSNADANIPFLTLDVYSWNEEEDSFGFTQNGNFQRSVEVLLARMGLDRDSPIILMCRSGSRSAAAANLLTEAGFTQVYSVLDGFEGDPAKDGPHKGQRVVNGWKNSGAPWTSELDRDKIF